MTDGNIKYTECRTCETKDGKFECGNYERQNAASNIGTNAGVFQEPTTKKQDPPLDINAGILSERDSSGKTNDSANNYLPNNGKNSLPKASQDLAKYYTDKSNDTKDSGKLGAESKFDTNTSLRS